MNWLSPCPCRQCARERDLGRILSNARLLYHVKGPRAAFRYFWRNA